MVNYSTTNGTAMAGSDYTATNGTLTFVPGETSKTFTVPIVDDTLGEPNETLTVTLSSPNNATLGAPDMATLTIVDDDRNFIVNITADAVDANPGDGICEIALGSGLCTLRAAIQEGNALSGEDTITLPSGFYTLTIGGVNEDAAATGDLDITDNLIINGAGEEVTVIDGNALDRVLSVNNASQVAISMVTIRNGNISDEYGGGIYNSGVLTLTNSAVSNNLASTSNRTVLGGGIFNSNILALINSRISDNTVSLNHDGWGGGGGVSTLGSALTLIDSAVISNTTTGLMSHGGGIYAEGMLVITNTVVSGNSAEREGGGIVISGAMANLTDSVVSNNNGGTGGGGIYILEGTLTFVSGSISNNNAGGMSGSGGGVYANVSTLTFIDSTIANNSSAGVGGGIYTARYQCCAQNSLTFINSAVTGNLSSVSGGGIYFAWGTLTLVNSTISGNRSAQSWPYPFYLFRGGGGIYLGLGTINLYNTTIVNNSVFYNDGGGLAAADGTTVNIKNSILAGNSDASPVGNGPTPDCAGTIISQGYNLIQSLSGCTITGTTTGNITETDPILGTLQDNGGATFTHALLPGSPAIDAGNPTGCTDDAGLPLITDQRRLGRLVDGNGDNAAICDIGAFEFGAQTPLSISDAALTEGDTGNTSATFTVTLLAAITQTVTVDFATADNTATANADYLSVSGSLTFTPGITTQVITVPVQGEVLYELDETFFVNLSNATNATVVDSQGVGTIRNNDVPTISISINDTTVPEGNSGMHDEIFTVSLSAPSALTVTVDYATANNTASVGSDYFSKSGSLIFSPGETSKIITVTIIGDVASETNETFFINLSHPVHATLGTPRTATITIQNDENPPMIISFSPISGPVGTSVTITGTNFIGATAVKFNGVNAGSFVVISATSITATVPSSTKTGPISVTTTGSTATSAANFTVVTLSSYQVFLSLVLKNYSP
jgi:CSLREA domain-containing protein